MSKKRFELLNGAQWQLIAPLLPESKRRKDKRGRPWASNRACLEGILWVLRTGAAWRFLPDKYPSPATCWRRLKQWEEQGVWLDAWRTLLGALDGEGPSAMGRDVFGRQLRAGEKSGSAVGKTKRGKGTKWMVLVDGGGLPLGVRLESASPGEVALAEATLAQVKVPRAKGRPRQKPKGVIADRAYDSDPLRRSHWQRRGFPQGPGLRSMIKLAGTISTRLERGEAAGHQQARQHPPPQGFDSRCTRCSVNQACSSPDGSVDGHTRSTSTSQRARSRHGQQARPHRLDDSL